MTRRDRTRWIVGAVIVVAFLCIAMGFAANGLRAAHANWDTSSGDQGGYLRLAKKIDSGDGFSNGNYHPLLPMLLQSVMQPGWSFFTDAKLLNVGLGVVSIAALFVLGWRMFGPIPGLLAASALSRNIEFVTRSARTEPEIVLTGLFFVGWAAWTLSLESRRWAWVAGLVAGLAYLAKGTGQFLLLGFMGVALLRNGVAALKGRPTVALVGLYLLAASPLLIDNTLEFGHPFYDFPSAHAMWYDEWDDRYLSDDGRHATVLTYLRGHSPQQIGDRLAHGVTHAPEMWARALETDVPGVSRRALAATTLLLVAFGGVAVFLPGTARFGAPTATSRLKNSLVTAGVLFAMTYVFFGWYMPVIASPRFPLPMVPVLYLLAAAIAWAGLRGILGRLTHEPGSMSLGAGVVMAVAVGTVGLSDVLVSPIPGRTEIAAVDRTNNAASAAFYDAVAGQLATAAFETVILGPDTDVATWPLYGMVSFEPIPSTVKDWAALGELMDDERATHVVIAPGTVEKRHELLGDHFAAQDGRVVVKSTPTGWSLVEAYPDLPCEFCLYHLGEAPAGPRPGQE